MKTYLLYTKQVIQSKSAEIGLQSDIRRMSVGMTRARRKLLVGDSATLCMHSLPASPALCSQKRRQPDNAWLYRSASSYKQVEKT